MLTDSTNEVFETLKARRQEEEFCLGLLDKNRKVLHSKCAQGIDLFCNMNLGRYLYKRLRRPAAPEIELKEKFKRSYANKELFTHNRTSRNQEYVIQRKRDFAVSQQRVEELSRKLKEEYEEEVSEQLRRHSDWVSRTNSKALSLISQLSEITSQRICAASIELSVISDALSFIPTFYSTIVKYFHDSDLDFDRESSLIPEFWIREYREPLRNETRRLFITLCEGCNPGQMIPAVVGRKCRSVCILIKPHVLSDDDFRYFCESVGWKSIFIQDFKDSVETLFKLLCESTEDILVFGFPRNPDELESLYKHFNPAVEDDGFLPHPRASDVDPFDAIIELDISDEIVVRDILASLEDPVDGSRYDVRELFMDTETRIIRLRHVEDAEFDVEQYASRTVTLKNNFEIIKESHPNLYHLIELKSRLITIDVVDSLHNILDGISEPTLPMYPAECIYNSLLENVQSLSSDLKDFFKSQWDNIERHYSESIQRSFELLHQTHQLMISHLDRSRQEMREFLCRPGTSQHLVIEFQQWHSSQVERCMRRMQRVKDECHIRLTSLREQLHQIETERKSEEETKQKELTNATLRSTLFELVNNACTLLGQAEIDRWTSTRLLMVDFNQIVSDVDLVPPLPHRKLTLLIDPARSNQRRGAKKPSRTTPVGRNRVENKLQPFESPLFEQLEAMKKFVSDASVIYVRVTTPVSTRGRRPVKDKNPFAAHKISCLEEFSGGFSDDDVYLISRLDEIGSLAREEIQVVQQSFDAFVDDSSRWIQEHYDRRRSIADTAVAYMMSKVNEEAQLNHLVLLEEDKCVVDFRQLLVANEEVPKVPIAFPASLAEDITSQTAETVISKVIEFEEETNQP
jgi:hypothetical protein